MESDADRVDGQEPQLKYTRLKADAEVLLRQHEATSFVGSSKVLVLGCSNGSVHVLDFNGGRATVSQPAQHDARVTALALGDRMEHVAAGSSDGAVRVTDLHQDASWSTAAESAVTCLAFPPQTTEWVGRQEVAVGTADGGLAIRRKPAPMHLSWLGGSTTVLVASGPAVHDLLWCHDGVFWCTDAGLAARPAALLSKSSKNLHLPPPRLCGTGQCSLARAGVETVAAAWPYAVQLFRLAQAAAGEVAVVAAGVNGVAAAAPQGTLVAGPAVGGVVLQQVAVIAVQYRVAGVAPFGRNLALLADVSPGVMRPEAAAVHPGHDAEKASPEPGCNPQTHANGIVEEGHGVGGASDASHAAPAPVADADAEATEVAVPDGDADVACHEDDMAAAPPGLKPLLVPPASDAGVGESAGVERTEGGVTGEASAGVEGTEGDATGDESAGAEKGDGFAGDKDVLVNGAAAPAKAVEGAAEAVGEGAELVRQDAEVEGEGAGLESETTGPSAPAAAQTETRQLQLRLVSTLGEELRFDDLDLEMSVQSPLPRLTCWYPDEYMHLVTEALAGKATPRELSLGDAPAAALSASLDIPDKKWWCDEDEPLFFFVTPHAVLLGLPCTTTDQVGWLLDHGRVAAAMRVAEADPFIEADMWARCLNAYLEYLLSSGQFKVAAQRAGQMLGADRDAWERQVFAFAQRGHLPDLAPHIPVESPTLSRTTYTMVVTSFLPHTDQHSQLLELLQRWPSPLVSSIREQALTTITRHLNSYPRAQLKDLQRVLALLHRQQGHHLQALELYLSISDPDVFAYIKQFTLYEAAAKRADLLMRTDEDAAVAMLVDQHEVVNSNMVVREVLTRADADAAEGRPDEAHLWRRRLYKYLHALFVRERRASHVFHDTQVDLYAEFGQQHLKPFLLNSKQYHMEHALGVCRAHGLIEEQVFILGRMNRATEALELIVNELHDIPKAIDFVHGQHDDSLWDKLISLSTTSSELAAVLLDQVGGFVDPLRLVQAIPDDLEIPDLNNRLRSIIKRFRTSVQLKQQCNSIIDSDCMTLTDQLLNCAQQPLRHIYLKKPDAVDGAGAWELYDSITGETTPCMGLDVPRDATRFDAPQHTLQRDMVEQVASGLVYSVDGAHACARGADGLGSLLEPETRQIIRHFQAITAQRTSPGWAMWSQPQ